MRRVAGVLVSLAAVGLLGEAYLRGFPPADLRPYLGDDAPGQDLYRPDGRLGIDYRNFDSFAAANAERLAAYRPIDAARPHRAMFGNSFVQMAGMLGDTARVAEPQHDCFFLGRNEPLPLRVAQIRLLLRAGLRPGRIVFAILPVDAIPLVQHPLPTWGSNASGVRTYVAPASAGSRLLLAGRLRLVDPVPSANAAGRTAVGEWPASLATDFDAILGVLAAVATEAGVPVTILLIPTFEQVVLGKPHRFQDRVTAIAASHRLDVCDLRDAFRGEPEPRSLFIPDKHFSPRGNAILFAALAAHERARP
jgi:hypothetical protein